MPRPSLLRRFSRSLPVRHDFFREAARHNKWMEEMAWLWGWLLADGCVYQPVCRQPIISLGVQSRDRDVLEKAKAWLQSGHKIQDRTLKYVNRLGVNSEFSRTSWSSREMADDLALLGIAPRKTHVASFHVGLLEPGVVDAVPHAIRGILEGDGCLRQTPSGEWRMIFAGNERVLYTVKDVLADKTGGMAKGSLTLNSGSKCTWGLSYGGNISVPSLCQFLYGGASPRCVLNRKEWLARTATGARR